VTVNLLLVDKGAWTRSRAERPHLPEVPSANNYYGEPVWSRRIGALMPPKRDHWWTITGPGDTPTAAAEVVAAIREFGLPALLARRTAVSNS
jgi:hypothetical protein